MTSLPIIDVDGLTDGDVRLLPIAREIDAACREVGFFLVRGSDLPIDRLAELDRTARRFFSLPVEVKERVGMARGGRAWRGWFPEGGEMTSGVPDRKEGLYLGVDLPGDDPRVRAGTPLHGPNLLPDDELPGFRSQVTDWLHEMHVLASRLLAAMAVGLGLDADWFDRNLTADPTILFRIFRYPSTDDDRGWGVAEHTDYGLLTILAHDGRAGLQVRTPTGWVDVPSIPDTFVVNIGDMLERLTGGRYRSTPHRVRRDPSDPDRRDRLSFPFFFDPGWDVEVRSPFDATHEASTAPSDRWDGEDPVAFDGTYGSYLLSRVRRVFPTLGGDVLDTDVAGGATPT